MKKKVIPAIIIIALIFIMGGIFALQMYNDHFGYSNEKADQNVYFNISGDTEVAIILGDEMIEEKASLIDGTYYLDFDSVQKYLNERFYYGEDDNILVYTTASKIITTDIGSTSWYDSEGETEDEGYVISRLEGETFLVALDYVKKYTNFSYDTFDDEKHIQLTTSWEDQKVATVKKDTSLRVRGGVKSEVLEDLTKDDTVVVLEELENWVKVKSSNSYIGYVEKKKLENFTTKSPIPVTDYVEEEYTDLVRDHKINLGFHNIGGISGNDTITSVISGATSLNVISPTWLSLMSEDGSISDISSASYVNTAHNNGMEVWVLVDNFSGNPDVVTAEMMSHASSRKTFIDNVISSATGCGADGINFDFEMIATEAGQSYIELVRELSVACRKAGLVFSIDNYVPMNFNGHYNLKEQGIVADYVVIMGYDEHYAGSAEAGSVASLSYVENGIINAIEDVDSSKVINAVPFYTRIWHTSNGTLSSEAVSMKVATEYINNHSVEMVWNSEAGQYYGEFTSSDGTLNQIWMEEVTSLSQKIDVMKANNVAGIAEWSLGMETSDVWEVIANFIEG